MYLNCHTYFSFKYGTLSVEALFKEAQRCEVRKLVLTDINNTSAYIEMLRLCREQQDNYALELVPGIEFRQDGELLYIAIAKNNLGFEEINAYLSSCNTKGLRLQPDAPVFDHAFVVYPWGKSLDSLRESEFIGIRPLQVNRLLTSVYRNFLHRLIVWQPVTFRSKIGFNIHRLLRAIDQNIVLSKLNERHQAEPDEFMWPENTLRQYYERYPQLIANTEKLLSQCHFHLEFGVDKNKKSFLSNKREDIAMLESMALTGFEDRYRNKINRIEAESRLYRELEIISKKDFEAYYLITHDIVAYARHRQYAHVGRGSGANSLVAYCIGLTDVDPVAMDLYFERFLNPERSSPPDFDMDFSWRDRDDIIQYVFDTYKYRHTALLGTHTTYKSRSVLRELGKVFGLPTNEIEDLVEYPERYRDKDNITQLISRYAERMLSIPANLSIHAGGILITEAPIHAYTATDMPPKGFPVTHFEMHNAEDIGVYKFDILSQRGLGHIKDAVNLIEKNKGIKEDINRFEDFTEDDKIRGLLSKGHTMGCFYVESPAMRMLLGKLRCADYITLVAASSIIRPGVARSGMMRAYIERHHRVVHGEGYASIHPKMDELMEETYGVMVYQEDVIKVAHHFGGLSLAEADILRRGMSGKFRSRSEFKRVEHRFFSNCRSKGYPEVITERVWYEIESFSGYSFSKGHSASYAVESYQSLYLKAHYPIEFLVAVINNFGGFYATEFYFHEARMEGADIRPPCVNHSRTDTHVKGKTVHMGFVHLKSLESKLAQRIVEEREENGPYLNLDNFIRRVRIGLEQLRLLIRVGAFAFTGKDKKNLLWEAHLYFGKSKSVQHTTGLFDDTVATYTLPKLDEGPLEQAYDEIELLGFPLCNPYRLIAEEDIAAAHALQLPSALGKKVCITGYLVTTKNTRTKNGRVMHFGTFYDREGQVFDTTHFPETAKYFPFRGKGFYLIVGKVVEDFDYPMIEVSRMKKIPMKDRYTENIAPLKQNPR